MMAGITLFACDKAKPDPPAQTARVRAEAKRHKDACASKAAFDRMKRTVFNDARRQPNASRSNLDTLEEFSFVRMENPVVVSWDAALELTRCRGRFILDAPPGAEIALGGERRMHADINYTAQAAADASGLVYEIQGAEPIVVKLAAFDLAGAAYRPSPAVDVETKFDAQGQFDRETPTTDTAEQAALPPVQRQSEPDQRERSTRRTSPTPLQPEPQTRPPAKQATRAPASREPEPDISGERTVRTFYNALGSGNGRLASAQVVPAKRSSRAYSQDAISRFYGRLPEPLRLTGVTPIGPDTYRVTYRYAATGSRCNGRAVVRLTSVEGRTLIRSIKAESGC